MMSALDDLDKEKLAEVLIPFVSPYFAWAAAVLLLVAGVSLSIYANDWTIFSRTGSLVIVVALSLASFDFASWSKAGIEFAQSFDSSELRSGFKESIKTRIMQDEALEGDKLDAAAQNQMDDYLSRLPERASGLLRDRLSKHEIQIGIIGTVVSGFGDLVGRII